MRLLMIIWSSVIVAMVSEAAIIQDLYNESLEDDNSVALGSSVQVDATSDENKDEYRQGKSINWAPLPVSYHIPSGVPVIQPYTYHVAGAVYSVPSPLAAPPQTPASTVLLPMLGQASGDKIRSEGEMFRASARGNLFSTCVWLLEKCIGIEIPLRARSLSAPDVTPAYLRYGYGPVPSVQYPINVEPQAEMPVATPYGPGFWCAMFAWKCLPNLDNLPTDFREAIRVAMVPEST